MRITQAICTIFIYFKYLRRTGVRTETKPYLSLESLDNSFIGNGFLRQPIIKLRKIEDFNRYSF